MVGSVFVKQKIYCETTMMLMEEGTSLTGRFGTGASGDADSCSAPLLLDSMLTLRTGGGGAEDVE